MATMMEWPSELAFMLEGLQPTKLQKMAKPTHYDDGPPRTRPDGAPKPGLTGSKDFTAAQRKLMYSVVNRRARCIVNGEARRMTLLEQHAFFPEYKICENGHSFTEGDEESYVWNFSYFFMDDGTIA
ncbi:hypothetical protein RJJ65_07070 [Rhizobium hidalgonense]|uniref:Uncharacterized protein n=1 Tax=Rhizobium hidalgonense TaxID=1538159 RepID=A0AAJ2GN93_9HYPH|nr:hypothetical protein [Rhizobium hidalgonense]MDR9772417.1 hypothetical protein [Rhizobium hidalgonense]